MLQLYYTISYIRYDIGGFYRLSADIDLLGESIRPAGTYAAPFTGGLDGDGHGIRNFKIEEAGNYAGLFASANGAVFRDLVIENAEAIQGSTGIWRGILAGEMRNCTVETISLCNITVNGARDIGGLAGLVSGGSLSGCSVRGAVSITGIERIGGIAGRTSRTTIIGCFVKGTGSIGSTANDAGGLVGSMSEGNIQRCYTAIEVNGYSRIGGLTGSNTGKISECYATGNVTGTTYVGGLAGEIRAVFSEKPVVSNCFATGDVISTTNNTYTGGLAGFASGAVIENSYASGKVSTGGSGLVYVYQKVTVTNSYFNSTLAGITIPTAQARTTEQMLSEVTYLGWDFNNIWNVQEMQYPELKNILDDNYQVPFELTFHDLTYDSVVIDWADIPGATEYDISYLDKTESSVKSEKQIQILNPELSYVFRVRAKIGNIKGIWSYPLEVKIIKRTPVNGIHNTGKGPDSITLEWNLLENVNHYEITYNENIISTTENICTLTNLFQNLSYVICIKAVLEDGGVVTSSPVIEKIYALNPQTEYAREFIEKCENQTWFVDAIENLLNLQGKSINTIKSKEDFATIYAIGLAERGISGKIPAAISEIISLKYLYLEGNDLNKSLLEKLNLNIRD